jgi:hypothetical protein
MYVTDGYVTETAHQVNGVLILVDLGYTTTEAISAIWLLAGRMTMDAVYLCEELLTAKGIPVDRLAALAATGAGPRMQALFTKESK